MQRFGLSDVGIEDAIYNSRSIRAFAGVDFTHVSVPDATMLLKSRRLLEKRQKLTHRICDEINRRLVGKGMQMRGGIVDASLIAAPPAAKNKDGERDEEMHQAKKGNDWYFAMKSHVGVHMATGLVSAVVGTAGNVSDVIETHALLHAGKRW